MAFGKIFESLFTGSLYGSGAATFAVWAYAIANSKPPGFVEINPRMLAGVLGCDVDEVQAAIDVLCDVDPDSRTPEEDGRRLVREGSFLYRLPTWPKYNAIRNEEKRREQNREAQARRRDRLRGDDNADVMLTDADCQHGQLTDADNQQCQPTEIEIVEPAPQGQPIDSLRSSHSTGAAEKPEKGRDHVYSEGFEQWWQIYPKRSGKGAAFKSWKKVATSNKARQTIMAATAAFAEAVVDMSFVPLPATWLNQRRFDDDPSEAAACAKKKFGRVMSAHIPNTPLGSPSCPCADCVKFRAKRVAQ